MKIEKTTLKIADLPGRRYASIYEGVLDALDKTALNGVIKIKLEEGEKTTKVGTYLNAVLRKRKKNYKLITRNVEGAENEVYIGKVAR